MLTTFLIAASAARAASESTAAEVPTSPFGNMLLPLMIGGVILVMMFTRKGSKRRQEEREAMLSAIKKNDVVWVHGGIKGWVHRVKGMEVILKVDPKENVKMTVHRDVITHVGDLDTNEVTGTVEPVDEAR